MMDEHSRTLWERVCATVNGWGQPKTHVPVPAMMEYSVPKIIDLHGMTVQEAFHQTQEFISTSKDRGLKQVTVVTGKSGVIQREFPCWIQNLNSVKSYRVTNGGGAFIVRLKLPKNVVPDSKSSSSN